MTEKYHIEKWDRVEAPNGRSLRIQMESEGYSVLEWSDRPGISYAEHEHGDDQSHWVVSGKIEFIVEGEGAVTLSAGDRDFMPAGTKHSARVAGDEPVFYLIGSKISEGS